MRELLIGHDAILKGLKVLAKESALSHGYLFSGPARVGKRTLAEQFARFLEKRAEGEAEPLVDVRIVEAGEKDSIGIQESRKIAEFLRMKPLVSSYRTAIIDNAETLTPEAQNAFLKTTEDAPASALIIFIATRPDVLKNTLVSRLQQIYCASLPAKEIETWLIETHACPLVKAQAIAAESFGAPGRAYMLFMGAHADVTRRAQEFLGAGPGARRTIVKSLIENEAFSLARFLDAVIEELTRTYIREDRMRDSGARARWHAVLALREQAEYFNLNPRLQLEALLV